MSFDNKSILLRTYIVLNVILSIQTEPPPHLPPGIYKRPPISNSYGPPPSPPVYGPPKLSPVVHKHVYVHIPPAEVPEYMPPKKPLIPSPPQKHYKIVFIKAPIPPTTPTPSIPPLQVNEEKTIIYVLVKKIEQAPDIVIPTPASTPLSKPEVYFIRYKTETEEGGGADTGGGYGKSVAPLKPDDYLGPSIPVETDDSDDSHKHKH